MCSYGEEEGVGEGREYDQLVADDYSIIDFKPVGIKTCGHLLTNASKLLNT